MAKGSASEQILRRGMFSGMPVSGWVTLATALVLFAAQYFVMQRFNTEGDAWYGWMPAYYFGAAALLVSFGCVVAFGFISWRATERRREEVNRALAQDFYAKFD